MERSLTKIQKEVIALERFFPHTLRERLERLLFALSIFFLSFSVLGTAAVDTRFEVLWPVAQGLFLISFSLLMFTIMIEAYFQSLYRQLQQEAELSFPVLMAVASSVHFNDLTAAFFFSPLGSEIFRRVGIAEEAVEHFLKKKPVVAVQSSVRGFLHHLAAIIHDEDVHVRNFLSAAHVDRDTFAAAAYAVEQAHDHKVRRGAFFGKIFRKKETTTIFEELVRGEITDLEGVYKITFTEQAIRAVVAHFQEDPVSFLSLRARLTFLVDLIEHALLSHAGRSHGANILMPSDVRSFIITKKAHSA